MVRGILVLWLAGGCDIVFQLDRVPELDVDLTVDTGHLHTCAVQGDSAWCWGWNFQGQLGDGTTEDRWTPTQVVGLTGVAAVSAGGAGPFGSFTCARTFDGEAWCWGSNSKGALGDGTPKGSSSPVQVVNLDGVTQIVAAAAHVCALVQDGTVWCWGAGSDGQLGDGALAMEARVPQRVPGLSKIQRIAAGTENTCALDAGGEVWCWGLNDRGTLDDSLAIVASPIKLPELAGSTSIFVGPDVTCGLRGGRAVCRGDDTDHELALADVAAPLALALSGANGCVVDQMHRVFCVGDNSQGQLGVGDLSARTTPTELTGFDAANLSLSSHACARRLDDTIWCWGYNSSGQVGNGTTTRQTTPVRVL